MTAVWSLLWRGPRAAFSCLCLLRAACQDAGDLRDEYLGSAGGHDVPTTTSIASMSPAFLDAVWQRMNEVVQVLHEGGMLGAVVFQFHTTFAPTPANMAYLVQCRQRLWTHFPMAVELRHRGWYAPTRPVAVAASMQLAVGQPSHSPPPSLAASHVSTPALGAATMVAAGGEMRGGLRTQGQEAGVASTPTPHPVVRPFTSQCEATLSAMRQHGIINIASDDLVAEMPNDGLRHPAYSDGRVFIYDQVTSPTCAYIRLHRRVGKDRVLKQAELVDWAHRMARIAATRVAKWAWPTPAPDQPITPSLFLGPGAVPAVQDDFTWTRLRGPIYFMIGTGV
ncbi:DUF72 domain-containing protein [archaeon]|nr:MAG: DUF72 domain-containing protein [archaeon]